MSNSDIVSAVNTLIVAYTHKSGSVDWRLVGQELGVDKDCARYLSLSHSFFCCDTNPLFSVKNACSAAYQKMAFNRYGCCS
ncbi:uncharacterized protein V2V93DRAFT_371788 [Kockiozyma suomiensis]|uniref:uncharacterized protein n=1 Tax=Kockiozyma suomiensis TaxID=1337062 RepID=UPI00334312B7